MIAAGGLCDAAAREFGRALELDEDHADSWAWFGAAAGDPPALERALALAPLHPDAWFWLAERDADPAAAARAWERAALIGRYEAAWAEVARRRGGAGDPARSVDAVMLGWIGARGAARPARPEPARADIPGIVATGPAGHRIADGPGAPAPERTYLLALGAALAGRRHVEAALAVLERALAAGPALREADLMPAARAALGDLAGVLVAVDRHADADRARALAARLAAAGAREPALSPRPA